jgi:hypothetical protein
MVDLAEYLGRRVCCVLVQPALPALLVQVPEALLARGSVVGLVAVV